MSKRFVSIFLPHLPIERLRRLKAGDAARPDLPFALNRKAVKGIRLTAVNAAASRKGLAPGMALADALAIHPALATQMARPQEDARELLRLARWCGRFGPASNHVGDDGIWIDISGCAHLFGGEAALLAKIEADFAALGYTARAALADSFAAAFAISHFKTDGSPAERLVPAGATRSHVAALPIEALRLAAGPEALLHRLGLGDIGALYELSRTALQRRFPATDDAEAVLLRLDQLLGRRPEPLIPLVEPPLLVARRPFPEALLSSEPLAAAMVDLIDEIVEQLAARHEGARRLTLRLWRLDGSAARITLGTHAPCRDQDHLFTLFREKLGRIEPGFGIDMATLVVLETAPLTAEQAGFEAEPAVRSDRQLPTTPPIHLLDRLANRLGSGRIGYLEPCESHIPERRQRLVRQPAIPHEPVSQANPAAAVRSGASATRPFLLLDPPEAITVMAPLPDAPPLLFTWRHVTRRVAASDGPERIAPEWWRELGQTASRTRDYYRVRTPEGDAFWLYRDGLYDEENDPDEDTPAPPRWYVHGFFT